MLTEPGFRELSHRPYSNIVVLLFRFTVTHTIVLHINLCPGDQIYGESSSTSDTVECRHIDQFNKNITYMNGMLMP